jgi:hypothetical protein
MPLTPEQIIKGVTLRVIADRHDRPVGTLARVMNTGVFPYDDKWWFTVEWLTYLSKGSSHSLRLWEEDLPSFELMTGPVEIATSSIPSKKRYPFQFKPPSPQQSFPFMDGLPRR